MCGGGGLLGALFGGGDTPTPQVVQQDPKGDQAKAEAEAASKANSERAARKRTTQSSSLLATGAQGVTGDASTSSVLAYGKDKLGQ